VLPMSVFDRPYKSIDELHEAELECLRLMFGSGSVIAMEAALHYCKKHKLTWPTWLQVELERMSRRLLSGTSTKKRGRSNADVPRYLQDMIHYKRWSAVDEVFEAQRHLQREIDKLRGLRGLKALKLRKQLEAKLADLGRANLPNAFASASEMLEGTGAACKDDAIKTSYDKVQRAFRDAGTINRATAMRYHILDPEFVRIARATEKTKSQGSKVSDFHNLIN
jgi:hypothetical protein